MKKYSAAVFLLTALLLFAPSQGKAVSLTLVSFDCPYCNTTTVAPGTDVTMTITYTVGPYFDNGPFANEHLVGATYSIAFVDAFLTHFVDGVQGPADGTPGTHSVSWHVTAPP